MKKQNFTIEEIRRNHLFYKEIELRDQMGLIKGDLVISLLFIILIAYINY